MSDPANPVASDAASTDGGGRFAAIDTDDCLHLVREHQVGRIGFVHGTVPVVLPVTYLVRGELIVFATAPGSILAALAEPGTAVAFEVDEVDAETATGWSVLITGVTTTPGPGDADGLVPWAPGNRSVVVGIRLAQAAGRVVSRAD